MENLKDEHKKTFVKNEAYYKHLAPDNKLFQDLSRHADEYDELMQDPLEQIAYWKNQLDEAEAKLDEIEHNCTLSKHEGCDVCEALVEAGVKTWGDAFADAEADRQDRIDNQIKAMKEEC